MPWDLMSDIHDRVNAPHYATNMEGKLEFENGSFKLIDFKTKFNYFQIK